MPLERELHRFDRIRIGDDVIVEVIKIGSRRVRLSVSAPTATKIQHDDGALSKDQNDTGSRKNQRIS